MTPEKLRSDSVSSSNVTDEHVVHPKFWVAALVQMNCEKKAAEKLNLLGYETFLPTQKETHNWSDRKKTIERIVIPMIIFIHTAKNDLAKIRNLSFIHKLLTLPGAKEIATPIPDEQIDSLKYLLVNADSPVIVTSDLKLGDRVQIIRGALKGYKGLLCVLKENHNAVAIRINGLGYAYVTIAREDIAYI